jgi:MFS family permease
VATTLAIRTDATGPANVAPPRRWVALGLLVCAQFVVMLDTSIVNVALPSIQADLHLSSTAVTWVVNAYVLAFGGLLLLSGRAADLFGRRRMFVTGSAAFTAGTLLAAFASNPTLLIGARVIQGIGAAALSPAAMSLLLLTFPGPARARAMSIWGAASGLGGATGIFLGGVLAGTFRWSSVFLITVPVSVAASSSPGRCSRRERAAPAAGSTGAARRPPPGQPAAKSMSSVSLDGRTCARLQ